MKQIDNIFDAEDSIHSAVAHLFNSELIYSYESASNLDAEHLLKYPKDDRYALITAIKSIGDAMDGNALDIEWRVMITCPSEFYKTGAGKKLVDVCRAILDLTEEENCTRMFTLIPDVHTFNEPLFDSSLVLLQLTFRYRGLL